MEATKEREERKREKERSIKERKEERKNKERYKDRKNAKGMQVEICKCKEVKMKKIREGNNIGKVYRKY